MRARQRRAPRDLARVEALAGDLERAIRALDVRTGGDRGGDRLHRAAQPLAELAVIEDDLTRHLRLVTLDRLDAELGREQRAVHSEQLVGEPTDAGDAQRLAMFDARLLAHEPRELHDRAQLAHLADHLGIALAIRRPRRARSWHRTPARDDRRALRPHALIEWQRC